MTYGDWQHGGDTGTGTYWYKTSDHDEDCSGYADECACNIQIVSAFEDTQDGEPHQWYAWLGGYDAHDRTDNSMTGLYSSRDEAVAALG